MDDQKRAKQEWEKKNVKPVLDRFPERRAQFETLSGIPLDRACTPADVDVDYLEDLGFPGQYPFTRGVQPTMYRGRFWTMRQYAGYAAAEESNARYKYLLEQGQTGLSVAFDLPTQIGYDADDPLAEGEVGKVGVSISSLEDMRTLFDDIPLDKVSTSMTINGPAAILLAMYIAVAKEQGVEPRQLRGTVQNDILKEYIARGTYIFPPRPSMHLVTDLFRYCAAEVPRWNTISISGYHIREAGSTAVQEIAFTLANGIAYVQAAIDVGLDVDTFAPRLSFFFNAHNDFLEEIAKFRAARRLWARIMRERFGAQSPRSWKLRFHTQTAGCTLTAQQPDNNVVRVALQALAAVLGGTQSLHTNSRDEALWLPTEESVRIALRTQQIIAHESGVANTVDPLAGSYVIEHLTGEIERRAQEYIERIDVLGGPLSAIEQGYVQQEIADAAYRYQREMETSDRIVVGVNEYQVDEEEVRMERLVVDPAIEEQQRARLAALRAQRDGERASAVLAHIEAAARTPYGSTALTTGEPLMPLFIAAVEADCTLGEICGVLRRVWGEYRPRISI
ncbi:MAG: methylmalonyl-CoA mutase family protein [Chloroflexi bacterium]|nr:methylmalonyl-CoA mutase family protein [Chloroflexota bacterium]